MISNHDLNNNLNLENFTSLIAAILDQNAEIYYINLTIFESLAQSK